jgi:conjugal transfer pilus assembly protein TrbC
MRKSLIVTGLFLTLSGVGAVLAQTSVDGLDLEAIDKRAQAKAAETADFVHAILERQSHASTEQQSDAQAVVDAARRKLAQTAAKTRPGGSGATGVDLDAMVADAGQLTKPAASGAPMFIAFASLSMPEESLQRMIADVTKAGGMVVFRGFSAEGGHAFMAGLSKVIPPGLAPHVGIDPRLFRAYHVEAVPTYVAASSSFTLCSGDGCESEPTPYDRMAGNVTAEYALETFAQGNGPGAAVAKVALRNLEAPE